MNSISRVRLIYAWLATVVVVFAWSVAGGAAMTVTNQLWVVACLVPPAVMLLVWPGAMPDGGMGGTKWACSKQHSASGAVVQASESTHPEQGN